MAIVFKEDKADYIQSLENSRNQKDLTPFHNFMNGQYIKFLTQEIQKFKNINKNNGSKGFSMIF